MRTCFGCDKELKLDYGSEIKASSNYHDATCWTSYGAWCSQAFDGLVGDFLKLEIIICDDCLKSKLHTAYGWENNIEYDTSVDLGELMKIDKLKGKPLRLIKSQKCGKFRKYDKS